MSGDFRNNLQAAILYNDYARVWPANDLNNFRMAMLNKGIPFRIMEETPHSVRMLGPDELQLMCTYFEKPADQAVFSQVLASPITRMLFPGAQDCVRDHCSHVLIEVQQGVFAGVEDNPEIAAFFEKIAFPRPGHNLGSFNRRLDILADACTFLHQEKPASAVHWTQSNTLVSGGNLNAFLKQTDPGLLTIHPMILAGTQTPGDKVLPVEIYTIGAADYIGREIHTDPAPVPWVDIYQCITAFVRLATMPKGYIIPDGHRFGIETDEFSWMVTHLDGQNQKTVNGKPYFNLRLLYHRTHGYTAPDHTGRELVEGGIREASAMLDGSEQDRRERIADWERYQTMARGAGGDFKIYKWNDPQDNAPPAAKRFGAQEGRVAPTFGKRKT
jgi:hypothetical protein